MTPKHVTLNDLEWSFCVKFCLALLRRYVCSSESDAWLSKLDYTLKLVVNVVGEL